jgi:hypothetical protein
MKRSVIASLVSLGVLGVVGIVAMRAQPKTASVSLALDWQKIESKPMALVAAGSPLYVRAVEADGKNLWRYENGRFQREESPLVGGARAQFRDLSAGVDGSLWAVTQDSRPVRFKGGATWELVPGVVRDVSIGSLKETWGLDSGGQIFRMSPEGWRMQKGPKMKSLTAGSDGTLWGLNAPQGWVFRRKAGANEWEMLPGALKKVVVDSGDVAAGVGPDGRVYRYISPPAQRGEVLAANRVGGCGANKRAYGIIKATGKVCRDMGGGMNGNPADADWTDCHLDWCVSNAKAAGYTPARPGTCRLLAGAGAIEMPAGDCRAIGGGVNGSPLNADWTLCHLDWCADDQQRLVAAKPGGCDRKRGYGIITTTAGDCRKLGGAMNGNPPDSQWTTCHLDWCDATMWAPIPGVSDVRSISLGSGGELWTADAGGAVRRLSLPAYSAIAQKAEEAGAEAARRVGDVQAQAQRAAQQAGDAEFVRVSAEAGVQYAAFVEGLAGVLGNLGLYTASRPGMCGGRRRAAGIVHMTARDCRIMGGLMNGNPADHDWSDCHLEWCTVSPGSGYSIANAGSGCPSARAGYGILQLPARDCRRMGGAMNGNPHDDAWTACHLTFCSETAALVVAAAPGWCKSGALGYGYFKSPARDCRAMGGNYNGEPADNDWTDCHMEWCRYSSPAVNADPFVHELLARAAERLRAQPLVSEVNIVAGQAVCTASCIFQIEEAAKKRCMSSCMAKQSTSPIPAVFQQEIAAAEQQVRAEWQRRGEAARAAKHEEAMNAFRAQLSASGLSLDAEKARADTERRVWKEAQDKLGTR